MPFKRQDNIFILADMQLRKSQSNNSNQNNAKYANQNNAKSAKENTDNTMDFTNTTDRPHITTGWGFLKKFFRENKNGILKPLEIANSPNIPRRLRRSSLGDHSISNKNALRRKNSLKEVARKNSAINTNENLLYFAVVEKDFSTLNKLFANGNVDVNFMRPPGLASLHLACVTGHVKVIEVLTENGADIRLKTSSGLTPLQIANTFGHFEAAQYLILQGADSRDVQNGIVVNQMFNENVFDN